MSNYWHYHRCGECETDLGGPCRCSESRLTAWKCERCASGITDPETSR